MDFETVKGMLMQYRGKRAKICRLKGIMVRTGKTPVSGGASCRAGYPMSRALSALRLRVG